MRKKIFTFLLALATSVGLSYAAPDDSGSCGANVTYSFNGTTGAMTITGTGPMTDFASASNAPWDSYRTSITSVTITDGVTSVGKSSFGQCTSLTTVTIGNDVETIGEWAFNDCGEQFTSLTLGNSIRTIGNYAFLFGKGITGFTLPSTLETIGDYAFCQNRAITTLTIPSNVTSIGQLAFYNCFALTSITTEATTPPTLGATVFDKVPTSIPLNVPNGSVAAYSAAAQWNAFNIQGYDPAPTPANVCGDGLTWELSEGVLTISYDGEGTGEMYDFGYEYDENPVNVAPWKENKSAITTVIVGDGVKSIGNYAFNDLYDNFTAVTIANSVERIGVFAFTNAKWVTEMTLPSALQTIDQECFAANFGITSITIPSGVTSIGSRAFSYCTALTSLTCEATTPPTLGSGVFKGIKSKQNIPLYVPSESVDAYEAASQWNDFNIQAISGGSTSSATAGIFANCYDCWRSPNYPNISGQCHLFNFGNPGVGNGNPSGPWKLEFVEYYNSSSTEYDDIVSSYAADQYGKSPEQMEVYRLYQWQNGAYQPVAYGVLYAYANENNAVEHAAFFEANGYWGCYLTGNTHSSGDDFNITFNEDASTGFADLHGGPAPASSGDKLSGVFSVSSTKAVNFSKGNLQYDSDNQIWQFAANQWDYIGNAAGNNAITADGIADNNGIVDMFCWVGASSSLEGIKQYGIIKSWSGYGSVAGEALKSDWGNIMGGDWRTLSKDEWIYLLTERTNAANLRTLGTVNGKAGLILMPDGWTASGVALTVTTANYTTNDINTTNWATLEGQGCAFLPAAGCCMSGLFDGVGGDGSYWSSTSRASGSTHAHRLHFRATDVDPTDFVERFTGMSVRLVSETTPTPAPTPTDEQVPTNADPENPSYHYSTFFHSTQNYKLTNDGTTAFIADLSGSDLVLTKIAEGTQVIPANTAVILRKTGSADPVVLVPTEENGVSVNPDDNSLEGVDDATPVTDITGLTLENCYVLSGTAQYGVGFYKINGTLLKAHKAYVKYTGGQGNAPKRMRFVFNTATDINMTDDQVQSTKVLRDGQLIIIRNGVEYNVNGMIVK